MLPRMDGQATRRTFLGLAAAGAAGAVWARGGGGGRVATSRPARHPAAATLLPQAAAVPENARPGTSDWLIRHLGAEHEIEGYAGRASVLPGEPLPLVVSTTDR